MNHHTLKGATHLFAALLPILLWACDPPGGDKKPEPTPPFLVSNLAQTGNYTFGAFRVATGSAAAGDYLLGVQLSSDEAPAATDFAENGVVKSGVFERSLSGTAINVYIPIAIGTTLPDAPVVPSNPDPNNFLKNDSASLPTLLLHDNREYTLYTLAKGGGSVAKLQTFRTDKLPAQFSEVLANAPPNYIYTVGTDERIVVQYYHSQTNSIYLSQDGTSLFSSFSDGRAFPDTGIIAFDQTTINYSVQVGGTDRSVEPNVYSFIFNSLNPVSGATSSFRIINGKDGDASFRIKRQ